MNKDTARTVADALTWSRIWSVVPITMLAGYQLKWWVFIAGTAGKLQRAWAIDRLVRPEQA